MTEPPDAENAILEGFLATIGIAAGKAWSSRCHMLPSEAVSLYANYAHTLATYRDPAETFSIRADDALPRRSRATLRQGRAGGVRAGPSEVSVVGTNVLNSHGAIFGTFNESRQTGELEGFLTPLGARTVKLVVRRSFGAEARLG